MKIIRGFHRKIKSEKGFTLIELIVVLTVLGVLATLTIPRVIGVKERAKESVDKINEVIIRNALERYYAEEGKYPAADGGEKLPKNLLEDYLGLDEAEIEKWEYKDKSTGSDDDYFLKKR